MKKIMFSLIAIAIVSSSAKAQVTNVGSDFKIINIGSSPNGDFSKTLILLHEIYNGTLLNNNYAVGTITARRGNTVSFLRLNVAHVNTSSGYDGTNGSLHAFDDDVYQNSTVWKLKTCIYNGKKYMAVEVPYGDAFHAEGYKFSGFTVSTGENMKLISYQSNGVAINQTLISNIQDYTSVITETHEVAVLNIKGNVGVGAVANPAYKLSVKGKIRAQEIRVDPSNWADYVFGSQYQLPTLEQIDQHIKEKGHLPGIPSADEVKQNGIELGEMNKKLLEKIEELTLHLIDQNEQLKKQSLEIEQLKNKIDTIPKVKKR